LPRRNATSLQSWVATVPHWFEQGKEFAVPVLQAGFTRDPDLPDVPLVRFVEDDACGSLTDVDAAEPFAVTGFECAKDQLVLVDRLRPRWLVARGDRSVNRPTEILVYLDGSHLGSG
jgi:hypothetical protein